MNKVRTKTILFALLLPFCFTSEAAPLPNKSQCVIAGIGIVAALGSTAFCGYKIQSYNQHAELLKKAQMILSPEELASLLAGNHSYQGEAFTEDEIKLLQTNESEETLATKLRQAKIGLWGSLVVSGIFGIWEIVALRNLHSEPKKEPKKNQGNPNDANDQLVQEKHDTTPLNDDARAMLKAFFDQNASKERDLLVDEFFGKEGREDEAIFQALHIPEEALQNALKRHRDLIRQKDGLKKKLRKPNQAAEELHQLEQKLREISTEAGHPEYADKVIRKARLRRKGNEAAPLDDGTRAMLYNFRDNLTEEQENLVNEFDDAEFDADAREDEEIFQDLQIDNDQMKNSLIRERHLNRRHEKWVRKLADPNQEEEAIPQLEKELQNFNREHGNDEDYGIAEAKLERAANQRRNEVAPLEAKLLFAIPATDGSLAIEKQIQAIYNRSDRPMHSFNSFNRVYGKRAERLNEEIKNAQTNEERVRLETELTVVGEERNQLYHNYDEFLEARGLVHHPQNQDEEDGNDAGFGELDEMEL